MNKTVREHYPAAKLPDDLRETLPDGAFVTVSIEPEAQDELPAMTLEEIFALARSAPRRDAEQIDAELRALRDEWQERD